MPDFSLIPETFSSFQCIQKGSLKGEGERLWSGFCSGWGLGSAIYELWATGNLLLPRPVPQFPYLSHGNSKRFASQTYSEDSRRVHVRGLAQGRASGRALQCVLERAHVCRPWLRGEQVWSRAGPQLVSYATSDICFFICDIGLVIASSKNHSEDSTR